jgi:hypothetical protein
MNFNGREISKLYLQMNEAHSAWGAYTMTRGTTARIQQIVPASHTIYDIAEIEPQSIAVPHLGSLVANYLGAIPLIPFAQPRAVVPAAD